MGPIPEDLIVFLILGLFVLVQIVRARRRKKARRAAVPPAVPVEVQAEAADTTPLPMPWIAEPAELPRPQPPARAQHLAPTAAPDIRRFSRRRLLGDRRSLQDAIVVATVLGPCLAQRPRDAE
jgi:hypothetical protein